MLLIEILILCEQRVENYCKHLYKVFHRLSAVLALAVTNIYIKL